MIRSLASIPNIFVPAKFDQVLIFFEGQNDIGMILGHSWSERTLYLVLADIYEG